MNSDFTASAELPESFPTRMAVKIQSVGLSPKKAFEYLAMLVVLGAFMYFDLARGYRDHTGAMDRIMMLSDWPLIFLKYSLLTAWPFGLAAAFDSTWTTKDAGNAFLAAYLTTNAVWFLHTGCGLCIFAASFRAIPFLLGGMIAHSLGACWRRSRMVD
jgi:hypothetical protein